MQKQINNAQTTPVHVKVAIDNEFRRFLLNPPSYEHLHSTLKNLFNLPSDFRIKFQDDENDWVLVSSDTELSYAIELSGSPLRLQVTLLTEDSPTSAPVSLESEPKQKWGRGGCRGGRGRGGREGFKISPEERLAFKSSRITARISMLEAKLNSEKLPSERERALRWKITKMQEKLATIQAMKESFGSSNPTVPEPGVTSVVPNSEETVTPSEEEKEKPWSCRGGHRGRGRGGHHGRFRGEEGAEHPHCHKKGGRKELLAKMNPEILANFHDCKAKLREARESGDASSIKTAREALLAAKMAKWDAIATLKAQEKDGSDNVKA